MTASDEAARLRALADQFDREGALEVELAEAKAAYRDNLGDADAKERLREAGAAIVAARQSRRGERVTIGGDAVQSNGNGG